MLKVGICTALNQDTLKILNGAGIVSVVDFLKRDPEQLAQELHIAYKNACSIRRVLLAEHAASPVSAAALYQTALSLLTILSTGYESLDELLDGGLYTGELTQIAGDSGTGKTRICMCCAATVVGTDGQSAVYIDTGSGFSAESLAALLTEDLNRLPLTERSETLLQSHLKHVNYIQTFDVFELLAVLDMLETEFKRQLLSGCQTLKLIVIDNIASVVQPIMGGPAGRSQGLLCHIGHRLKQMAVQFSVAVLVVNNMTSSYNGSLKRPALGKAWSHVPQTSLLIRRPQTTTATSTTLMASSSCATPITVSQEHSLREVCLIKSNRQQTPSVTTLALNRSDTAQ
ncbi:hypothetical protein BsWGS_07364 [Bradybaena similaris]